MIIEKLAADADNALKRNQAACEEQITQQVGDLCAQAQNSVSTVSDKFAGNKSLIAAHISLLLKKPPSLNLQRRSTA